VVDFDPISDDSYIYPYDYDSFNRCHIHQNDVLIAIYGTVGKSAVYKEEYVGKAGIPRHIANITLNKNAPITPEYLTAFFRSKFGKWQMNSVMTGNIQQLLSLKNLRDFDVPVPEKSLLDRISSSEQKALQCEIEAKKLLKEAQRLFYEGLNFDVNTVERDFSFTINYSELDASSVWSTSFYDKLYVKMASAFEKYNGVVTLREITDMMNGDEVGSDNYVEYIDRSSEDVPFIRTSDIVNNEVDLYPDYYIPEDVAIEVVQDVKPGDVIFTKDGKIACTGMIVEKDKVILSSGIECIRLNDEGRKRGLTQEYLFVALNTPEVGRYAAVRRTVVASTIPHLRVERLKDIEVPLEKKEYVEKITELVKKAFELKNERKTMLKESENVLDEYFQS
jgi:type I restriction enzyme S subunit